jgi:hypothetical protein
VVFDAVSVNGQAEILGVPTELLTAWSKRTRQIKAEAGPVIADYETILGRDLTSAERAAVTKVAVLKTRTAKEPAADVAKLKGRWRDEAKQLGWDGVLLHHKVMAAAADGITGGQRTVPNPAPDLPPVVAAGRRHGVFSQADLTVAVAAATPVAAQTADQVRVSIEKSVAQSVSDPLVVNLGQHPHGVTRRLSDTRFTSTEVLAAEARVLAAVHDHHAGDGGDAVAIGRLRRDRVGAVGPGGCGVGCSHGWAHPNVGEMVA